MTSPVADDLVDFPAAIAAVISGKRITKQEWGNASVYGMLRDGFLMLRKDGAWHRWTLNDGDLYGIDWRVME